MHLSNRLLAVANMVSTGNRLADVGTDHGYIPIYLIQQKKVPSAIAMDIRTGPLHRAEEHIRQQELGAYIETRLSDGVFALKQNEADTVLIAGMGGGLMKRILLEGEEVLQTVSELVLQPQSEVTQVRRFLCHHGYMITQEDMIEEDGKYYPMMKAIHQTATEEQELFFRYGRMLLEGKHPVLYRFLLMEQKAWESVLLRLGQTKTPKARQREQEIKQELKQVEAALQYYEV